ncbi:type II secretion system minor pseudopilin GspK [Arenimonas aestuarii]
MKSRPQGAAIVMAMAVVALAALAATALLLSQSIWTRRVELDTRHGQAQHVLEAGLDWSRALLHDDLRASQVDHAGEPWAMQMPPIPVEGGQLAGAIDDQQARFNLNNLVSNGKVDAEQLAILQRLLVSLDLPGSLATSLGDWLDADGIGQGGAEDAYYLGLESPYLAANRPLADLDELARVRGFDPGVRARLRPFVTALPRGTPINVNTAGPEVLAALLPGLGPEAARALVASRERAIFLDRTGFLTRLPEGMRLAPERISVNSDYFLVTMSVELHGAQARGSALLVRDSAGWPGVAWRKFP